MPTSTVSLPNLAAVFASLRGTWTLSRVLSSQNPTDPSGHISGLARFTPRSQHTTVGGGLSTGSDHDESGRKYETHDLLYTEEGAMKLADDGPTMRFSKKYIWRLSRSATDTVDEERATPKLSVWFVKPGTEQEPDYLFHELDFRQGAKNYGDGSTAGLVAEGNHLCIDDMYETRYVFEVVPENVSGAGLGADSVERWRVLHVVKGPTKEQRIATWYTRA